MLDLLEKNNVSFFLQAQLYEVNVYFHFKTDPNPTFQNTDPDLDPTKTPRFQPFSEVCFINHERRPY